MRTTVSLVTNSELFNFFKLQMSEEPEEVLLDIKSVALSVKTKLTSVTFSLPLPTYDKRQEGIRNSCQRVFKR